MVKDIASRLDNSACNRTTPRQSDPCYGAHEVTNRRQDGRSHGGIEMDVWRPETLQEMRHAQTCAVRRLKARGRSAVRSRKH